MLMKLLILMQPDHIDVLVLKVSGLLCIQINCFKLTVATFIMLPKGEAYSRHFVHPSVCPVPCPANNLKTTGGIYIKLGI